MARIVAEQVFDPPLSEEASSQLARRIDECLMSRYGCWRRSYVSLDRRRVTCEFDAPDAESVREAMRLAGAPFERVWVAEVFAVEDSPELQAKLDEAIRRRPGQ